MAKIGLRDTLALRAAGYSKKEIEALAAIDDEQDQKADQDNAADNKKEPDQKDENVPESTPTPDPEPDYKAMYEELMKKNQESLEKLKKLQEQNVHKNMAPDAAAQLEKQTDALLSMVRDFM